MLCSDAIMSSVVSKYFAIISSMGRYFVQKSSYIFCMISLFLSPSSLSFAPTLLQMVKNILYLNSVFKQLSIYVAGFWQLVITSTPCNCFTSPVATTILSGLFCINNLTLFKTYRLDIYISSNTTIS